MFSLATAKLRLLAIEQERWLQNRGRLGAEGVVVGPRLSMSSMVEL